MKKLILALCFFPALLFAQKETITGKIVKKPWSKSTESYCAQGSDYLVVQVKGQADLVLDFTKNKINGNNYIDKVITLNGTKIMRTIDSKKNDKMEQRPVNPLDKDDATFTCQVFEVLTINTTALKKAKMNKKNLEKGK